MSMFRLFGLTLVTMIAFAANSILCRLALQNTQIDPATFTAIRLMSGALMLWLIVRKKLPGTSNSWRSPAALFVYAITFSFAYVSLSAGTGALLLFSAVQLTMITAGIRGGERPGFRKLAGTVIAICGLIVLVLPGVSAPPMTGAILMITAGIAWGLYSLFGRSVSDPSTSTAVNFIRAVPMVLIVSLVYIPWMKMDNLGLIYAVLSGGIASGMGYVIWYKVLPFLAPTTASTVQLCVPLIAALGGVVFLNEMFTFRLAVAGGLITGGIALVIIKK